MNKEKSESFQCCRKDLTGTELGARFSSCEKFRYELWRTWDPISTHQIYIMLNPSTADHFKNDPTVERCERRARMLGFGGIYVLNLFALRATDPCQLKKVDDPIGPENDLWIKENCIHAPVGRDGAVVVAWGNDGALKGRSQAVLELLIEIHVDAWCLGVTKQGHPYHPLYIPYDRELVPYGRKES